MIKCDRVGCENEGRWYPVLIMRPFASSTPARGLIPLPTCDGCKPKVTVDDLVTDENWPILTAGFRLARKLMPKRSLTRLAWALIDSDETREFLNKMPGPKGGVVH